MSLLRLLPTFLFGLSLFPATAVAAPTEPAPDPLAASAPAVAAPPKPAGFRASSTYVHLSPGIGGWVAGAPILMYGWGVSAGRHIARGRHFAVQIGGFFEDLVWTQRPTFRTVAYTTSLHQLRIGPELRIGGGNERVFGYGLVRAGLDVIVVNEQIGSTGPRTREAYPAFVASVGAGVQGALGARRRILLGFEPGVDFNLPGEMPPMLKARVFLGFRF